MSIVLLLLGVLLAAAGGALIGFGVPINELSRGATMILSGSFAVVGGVLLIGLAAVVAKLTRIATLLHASRTDRPARVSEAMPAAEPVVVRASLPAIEAAAPAPVGANVEVSATAIERLRSSIPRAEKNVPEAEEVPLSPNGSQAHPVEPRLEPPPRFEPAPRSAGAAAVETPEPRLDFLFRPRQPRQTAPQENFDALWPRRSGRERQLEPRIEEPRAAPAVEAAPAATTLEAPPAQSDRLAEEPASIVHAEEPEPEQRSVAILKSGVVDGMAYTLYADGSIEAQLPQGTVRFGSISELRAHIENNS
jgi:hypothetical protein